MSGIFLPRHLRSATATNAALYAIELDRSEAFLEDHQPGSDALFGTVMGIEAMACTALAAARTSQANGQNLCVSSMENIHILAPYIFHGNARHTLEVETRPVGQDEAVFQCAVTSPGEAERAAVAHFEACVQCASGVAVDARATNSSVDFDALKQVGADAIYRLFFHGPSFRVVDRASWQSGFMVTRLATDLPGTHRSGATTAIAPRLIEFAMQSSGLLQLAESGAMMIPDSIARIECFSDLEVDGDGDAAIPLYAVARNTAPAGERTAYTIEVVDTQGRLHMRVENYRTTPLPFAIEIAEVERLAHLLQATAV